MAVILLLFSSAHMFVWPPLLLIACYSFSMLLAYIAVFVLVLRLITHRAHASNAASGQRAL